MIKLAALIAAVGVLVVAVAGPPLKAAESASAEDYILGSRDEVQITIWGEERMTIQVDVSEEGIIHYFFIGDVQAAGLTVKQLREKLTSLLSQYFKDPVVSVRIITYRSKEVLIVGAVKAPGVYYLETNTTRLIKLISQAGGTASGRGNRGIIYRGATDKIKSLKSGSSSETGDDATANGDAKINDLSNYDRIVQELIAIPGIERIEVDLAALLDYGDPAEDVIISSKDIVIISSDNTDNPARNFIWVGGAVRTPQKINWQPGLTVSQAITQCGGISDISAPNRSYITRKRPDGQTDRIRVKLKNIQKGKIPDVPLDPGDQITVPESIF